MKKNYVMLFIITILLFTSCNKKAESQLYIVDSIKLGGSMQDYNKIIYKKPDLSNKPGRSYFTLSFFTQQFLYQEDALSYLVGGQYTLTFNDDQDTELYTDYAIFSPETNNSKENLLGLKILFGRTISSVNIATLNSLTNAVGENTPAFIQSNRKIYIENVKQLLINKYGQPTKIIKNNPVPFYAFQGKSFNRFMTTKENTGDLLEWDLKYLKVIFFEGFDNYNFTYDYISNEYLTAIDENRNLTKKLSENNEKTKSFSYIYYELKPDYIEKQKLNLRNL